MFRVLIKRQILTSREVLNTKLCSDQYLFCKKDAFQNTVFLSLKMSAQAKKKLTQHVSKYFPSFKPTRKWVNKVNLSSFSTQNLFQIRACVISARKAKHLDVTTMFTYSHANTPLGQSERAYYLSYFIKLYGSFILILFLPLTFTMFIRIQNTFRKIKVV